MKGSPEVIATLQAGLAAEAHLNIQCRQYQRSLKYMGLKKVAKRVKRIGDHAHCYQKCLSKRALLLGGTIGLSMPSIEDGDRSLTKVLQNLLDLNLAIVEPYEKAVQVAMDAMDDTSRNLFEHLLKWHQNDDVCWLEQQLELIKSLGESDYITTKI